MSIGQVLWRSLKLSGTVSTICVVLLILLLSACGIHSSSEQQPQGHNKIASPPDIPDPPASLGDEHDPNSPQVRLVYQDVIDLEQQLLMMKPDADNAATYEKQRFMQSQGFSFIHAIQEGIRRQVLTPPLYDKSTPVYFEPQVPVVYRDFYTWVLGFADMKPKDSESENTMGYGGKQPTLSGEGWSLNTSPASMSEEEALQRFGISLPLEANDVTQNLLPDDMISREMLCFLYTRLSHQQDKAKHLSNDDIEQASSGKSKLYAVQNFQDRTAISPWASRYVALAYQDGVLKNVFGLRPTALVNGKGFQPKKPVTRAEAITFLYQFFSTHSFQPQPGHSSSSSEQQANELPMDTGENTGTD